MGPRADFYVGRGEDAEWLGSIAWDGYPDAIDADLLRAKTSRAFHGRLKKFFTGRTDVTLPKRGWPWPWDDSATTDYAYAFDGARVWASCFGGKWFAATSRKEHDERSGKSAVFPNMKARQNVRFDVGSGLVIVQASK